MKPNIWTVLFLVVAVAWGYREMTLHQDKRLLNDQIATAKVEVVALEQQLIRVSQELEASQQPELESVLEDANALVSEGISKLLGDLSEQIDKAREALE